ncbi:hypothetical protein RvY_06358 [Ramazzottius varieornatus]|uniref:Uncharacterized protein n=1 Tax=Ramazzottius varieornatus TaxID=947166 RepID=A0A1D1V1A3_RAMVA|nr:hypothetical protein RvY_06358 [Ramazzottius varieornatus]
MAMSKAQACFCLRLARCPPIRSEEASNRYFGQCCKSKQVVELPIVLQFSWKRPSLNSSNSQGRTVCQ